MAETFPFSIPSGNSLVPATSGLQSLGSESYPFLGIYGNSYLPTRLISGVNYTGVTTDYFIDVDTTGGSRVVTLPTAIGYAGKQFNIRKLSSDGYSVVITGTSSQTINGVGSKEILYQYSSMSVLSNGTNWRIV